MLTRKPSTSASHNAASLDRRRDTAGRQNLTRIESFPSMDSRSPYQHGQKMPFESPQRRSHHDFLQDIMVSDQGRNGPWGIVFGTEVPLTHNYTLAIEHCMFSAISLNGRGRPLTTLQTVVNLIGHTRTKKGLTIQANLDLGSYPTGQKPNPSRIFRLSAPTVSRCGGITRLNRIASLWRRNS